MLAIINPTT